MGNRTDKKGYLGLILVLGVITVCAFFKIMPKYQLKLFETKISASVFFITLSLFSVIGGLVISVKKERNLKSALIIWLLPCLIYLSGFYWKSLTFWYITLFLIIAGSLLMTRISREIARSSMSDNDSYVVLGKRSRYIVVRAIICFALAAGVLLGTFIEKEKIFPQNTNTKQDYQAKKKANDQSKYLLFFDNWQNTTSEQKKQAVMALIDLETKALGINGNYQINITCLGENDIFTEKNKPFLDLLSVLYEQNQDLKSYEYYHCAQIQYSSTENRLEETPQIEDKGNMPHRINLENIIKMVKKIRKNADVTEKPRTGEIRNLHIHLNRDLKKSYSAKTVSDIEKIMKEGKEELQKYNQIVFWPGYEETGQAIIIYSDENKGEYHLKFRYGTEYESEEEKIKKLLGKSKILKQYLTEDSLDQNVIWWWYNYDAIE